MEKQEFWIIKFDDADAGDLVFAGEGAEEAAQETYELRSQSWNCHLFGPAELIATLRTENERLKAQVTAATKPVTNEEGIEMWEQYELDDVVRRSGFIIALKEIIARRTATQKGSE